MLNVLALHSVVENVPVDFADIQKQKFIKLCEFISEFYYDTIGLDDHNLNERIRNSTVSWALTFDDGWISDYEIVLPILIENRLPATFFVVTEWIGKAKHISWTEIREMVQLGMTIGSHTCTHPKLIDLPLQQVKEEMLDSKKELENNLGKAVSSFAFPFGYYSKEMIELAFDCEYKTVCILDHGMNRKVGQALSRNSINSVMTVSDIKRILFPNSLQRAKWWGEDIVKQQLKIRLGDQKYQKLRGWYGTTKKIISIDK